MKELSIEEKVRRYDEIINEIKNLRDILLENGVINENGVIYDNFNRIFPELKESEDERIRKALINGFKDYKGWDEEWFDGITVREAITWLEKQGKKTKLIEGFNTEFERQVSCLIASAMNRDYEYTKDFVKWTSEGLLNYAKHEIEKQGEHKPTIEMITPEESIGIDSDTYNKIVDECIYGKQKPADRVKLKFKVGDTVKDPYGDLYHITEITDDSYKTDDGRFILFKNQEVYTLSNFTAWSEEDERMKNQLVDFMLSGIDISKAPYGCVAWLKSIKDKYSWKPSDEQMLAINTAINVLGKGTINGKYLIELLEQLKKLREEKL